MAKYKVKFKCGHEGTVNLTGKHSYREWKLEQYENDVCSDCKKKLKEEALEKNYQEAITVAAENDFVPLVGEDLIVKKATLKRHKLMFDNTEREETIKLIIDSAEIAGFKELAKKIELNKKEAKIEANKIIENLAVEEDDAQIYYKYKNLEKKVLDELDYYYNYEDRSLEEKIKKQALISVENPKSIIPVEIVSVDNGIQTVEITSEKNDEIILICKELGYKWNPNKKVWYRNVYECTKEAEVDSLAEIANALLSNGFCVRVYNKEARDKAVSGDFNILCKRWIRLIDDKFIYEFPRNDKIYQIAKSVKGTRWNLNNSRLETPSSSYREVIDFAKNNDFCLSNSAKKWLEKKEMDISETIASIEKTIEEKKEERRKKLEKKKQEEKENKVLDDLLDD